MVKKQLDMVQVSNASPQEVEAGGSEVQSLLQLYRELQVSLGYTRPSFNQSDTGPNSHSRKRGT